METCRLYPGEVRRLQIFLAEVNEVAAFFDRQPPIVIDDELALVSGAQGLGFSDLGAQPCLIEILDAELHQPDAERRQTFDPGGAVDDQIKRIEFHWKTARPIVGVDGTATSRGSSNPER